MLRPFLLAATAAALIAPAGASAAAGWTAPEPVPTPVVPTSAELGVAADGTLAVTWQADEPRDITATTRRPGAAAFDTPSVLPESWDYNRADLDADDQGTITAVGRHDGKLKLTTRPVGGTFGPAVTVADTAPVAYLDVSPNGSAIVVWREGATTFARIREGANGTLGPEMTISTGNASNIHVAIADSGEALVTYNPQDGDVYKIRPAGGVFPAEPSAFGTAENAQVDDLAMNADGDAQVVLLNSVAGRTRIGGAHRYAGDPFSVVTSLSDPVVSGSTSFAAVSRDGDGAIVWPVNAEAEVVIRRGFVYYAPQSLGPRTEVGAVRVGFDANDAVVAAFERFGADPATGDSTVWAARTAGEQNVLGEPAELATVDGYVNELLVGADARGGSVVMWQSETDDAGAIGFARTPVPPADPGPGDGANGVPPAPAGGTGPAGGAGPGAPGAPVRPRSAAGRSLLAALKVTRKGTVARVTFRLAAPAAVTLRLQRRAGRRWVAAGRRAKVRGRAGANRATLSLKGLPRGRYRVTATAGGAVATAGLQVAARRR